MGNTLEHFKFYNLLFNNNFIVFSEYIYKTKRIYSQLKNELTKYDKEIIINPNSSRLYLDRGQIKIDLSDFVGAIKDFDKSIELDTSDIESYFLKAYALYKLKDYKTSITFCTKAIQIDPNNSRAYLLRCKSKNKIGDIEGAQVDSIKANYLITH